MRETETSKTITDTYLFSHLQRNVHDDCFLGGLFGLLYVVMRCAAILYANSEFPLVYIFIYEEISE